MNIPGHAEGNWSWRCTEDLLSDRRFEWLRDLTKNSERLGMGLSSRAAKALQEVSRN
jgi:4-alpha-glucanotransferase